MIVKEVIGGVKMLNSNYLTFAYTCPIDILWLLGKGLQINVLCRFNVVSQSCQTSAFLSFCG